MLSINYDHINYSSLIKTFGAKMEAPVQKNFLALPASIGGGYIKYYDLSSRLQCLIADFKSNEDIYLCRKSSDKEFYTLRFIELVKTERFMLKIGDRYMWEDMRQNTSVLLTSSSFDFSCLVSKGTVLRSINILIPKTWLLRYLDENGTENADEILKRYLMLKTASYNFVPFDIEYRELFNEIIDHEREGKASQAAISNIAMMMVEKFMSELVPKLIMLSEKNKTKISADEVKRLITVESYLVNNFSTPPPSISSLSRIAAMSTTSLKNKFKKMYGSPLYEYFQKGRMQRAKVLMLTRKYSIKEIGCQLGYSNLSNFSIAFKKEFKRLPSHFLMSGEKV